MDIPSAGKTRILINLGSFLLGRALQGIIGTNPSFETFVATDSRSSSLFDPHHIVVDVFALAKEPQSQWPNARMILIDTGLPEDELISLLLHHKFYGVVSTDTPPEMFSKVLHTVNSGQIWIDNDKIKALLHNQQFHQKPAGRANLSKKEQDIVAFIAQGLKNREIAQKLCISEQTVKTHISRIFKKVDVSCRSQLVPLALKLRI
ncbi:response regulator transcription factor [Geotalea sp. SG265]|uniref:response regulator transcription factor n=1 Tax=Geotalea sp. SG265 TaxID=2922867 RepID=UPI001FAF5E92|nr:response regulator transcription factor [Geotalea sp. SG265]